MKKFVLLLAYLACMLTSAPLQAQYSGRPAFVLNKNAKDAIRQEQYQEAITCAVWSLINMPVRNKPAAETLEKYFGKMVESENDTLTKLQRAASTFDGDVTVATWKAIVTRYEQLEGLFTQLQEIPKIAWTHHGISGISPQDFQGDKAHAVAQLAEAQTSAAEMHYQNGLAHMAYDTEAHYRTAAKEFVRAQDFVANYRDCEARYEDCRARGTRVIAVFPFRNATNNPELSSVGANIALGIAESANASNPEFTQVLSPRVIEEKLGTVPTFLNTDVDALQEIATTLGVHEIWFGQIDAVRSSEPARSTQTVEQKGTIRVKKFRQTEDGPKPYTVNEDAVAYAQVVTTSVTTTVTGRYTVFSLSDQRLTPYPINLTQTFSQNQYAYKSGEKQVYRNESTAEIPSLVSRVESIRSDYCRSTASSIVKEANRLSFQISPVPFIATPADQE